MIKRMLLKKAVEFFELNDVNLSLITSEKIVGDAYKDAVEDLVSLAIEFGFVISFQPNPNSKRFKFEIFMDLPF